MCSAKGSHCEGIETRVIKICKSAAAGFGVFLPDGATKGRELKEIMVGRVDLVKRGANGKRFAIMKSEGAFFQCENCGQRYPKAQLIKLMKAAPESVICNCGLPIELHKADTATLNAEDEAAAKAEEAAKKVVEDKAKADADALAAADKAAGKKTDDDDARESVKHVIEMMQAERDVYKDKAERLAEENKELNDKVATLEADNAELEKIANENLDRASTDLGIGGEDDEAAQEEAKRKAAEEAAKNK